MNRTSLTSLATALQLACSTASVAQQIVPIDNLPAAAPFNGTERMIFQQGPFQAGKSVRGILSNFAAYINAQSPAVVGSSRNMHAIINGTGANVVTFSADYLVVATTGSAAKFGLPNYSQIFDVTTVGNGGVDIGTIPSNGWVCFYGSFNPGTGQAGGFATDCSSMPSQGGSIYSNGHAPAGYTATALIGVWQTDNVPELVGGEVTDHQMNWLNSGNAALHFTSTVATASGFSIAASVPPNAIRIGGNLAGSCGASGSGNISVNLFNTDPNIGQPIDRRVMLWACTAPTNPTIVAAIFEYDSFALATPQTVFVSTFQGGPGPFQETDVDITRYNW